MAIHARRHTYDPSAPLMPWVQAIARYKLIDHLRQTRASSLDVPIESADDLLARMTTSESKVHTISSGF